MREFLKKTLLILAFAVIYYLLEEYFNTKISTKTPGTPIHITIAHPFMVFISIVIDSWVGGIGIAIGSLILQIQHGQSIINWVVVICPFLNCLSIGYMMKSIDLRNEYFGRKLIYRFFKIQIISTFVCWVIIYPLLNVLMWHKGYLTYLSRGFWQSLGFILSCGIATTLFLMLYARSRFTEANFYRS